MGTMQRTKWGCVARRLVISLLRFSWGRERGESTRGQRRRIGSRSGPGRQGWTSPPRTGCLSAGCLSSIPGCLGAGCPSSIPGCLGPLSFTFSSSAFPGGLVGFPFSWSAWHKRWQHMHIRFSCLHTVSEQCWLFSCQFLGQGIGSYVSSLNQVWQRTQQNCLTEGPLPISPIPRDTQCVL